MALSLADILKAKRGQKGDTPKARTGVETGVSTNLLSTSLTTSVAISDLEEGDTVPYVTAYQPEVDKRLFLAVYSRLIQNPYEMEILAFREFREFVLGADQPILNTFAKLNLDLLFVLYMQRHKPMVPRDLVKLWWVLCELELCVPGYYQKEIEALICCYKERKIF